jgi:predicted dehydrogenase
MKRRDFIKLGSLTASSLIIAPNAILGKRYGHTAPSDKLNIAAVGIGGKGHIDVNSVNTENIVALCDVDWKYAQRTFEKYPNAKKYWDYRKMYDEMGKSIDAVVVATADHTHAIITADAITLGKHVYTEKPLTHTVYEARLLTTLAERYKIASQMGNQGASCEGVNLICEWIWNGEIGEVKKVEAFTDRPIWPQGLMTPEEQQSAPDTLKWDLFLGPAQERAYHNIYHPWNWRGWWDFGTGALGDMACHILHPVFKALKLGYPIKADASSTLLLRDCAPQAQHVVLTFPARTPLPKVTFPEVAVHWYDGGLKPEKPEGLTPGENLNIKGGAVIFHGTKDTLICGCYGLEPRLLSGRVPDAPKVCRRISPIVKGNEWPGDANLRHEQDWVRACKESPENRVKSASDFSEAGPFTEMVVMGVPAVRLQALEKELLWDGQNMRFTNIGDDEKIRLLIRDGFTLNDGHPTFNKKMSDPLNARAFAESMIKHNYRSGWKLPDML